MHAKITRGSGVNATRLVATTGMLEHLQMPPFAYHAKKGFEPVLDIP